MKIFLLVLTLIFFHHNLYAQEETCKVNDLDSVPLFDKSYEIGIDITQRLCEIYNPDFPRDNNQTSIYDKHTLINLSNEWRTALKTQSAPLDTIHPKIDLQIDTLYSGYFEQGTLEKMEVKFVLSDVKVNVTDEDKTTINMNACTTTSFAENCRVVFEQFAIAANVPYELQDKQKKTMVAAKAGLRSANWNSYFSDARSQTLIELYLNAWLYSDEIKMGVPVDPPSYQVALFHPSIVIQQISDANDGDQLKEAIAIEWIGINFWQERFPIGVSFVSTYSDRAGIKDVGNGLMFHFKNNYSLGVTHHNNDNNVDDSIGVFLTVDLLGLFESTQSNYKDFLNAL